MVLRVKRSGAASPLCIYNIKRFPFSKHVNSLTQLFTPVWIDSIRRLHLSYSSKGCTKNANELVVLMHNLLFVRFVTIKTAANQIIWLLNVFSNHRLVKAYFRLDRLAVSTCHSNLGCVYALSEHVYNIKDCIWLYLICSSSPLIIHKGQVYVSTWLLIGVTFNFFISTSGVNIRLVELVRAWI